MKQIALLTTILILALWGCSKDDESGGEDTTTTKPLAETIKVGDHTGGGILYYIAKDRSFGLVAAHEDLENAVWSAKRKIIPTEVAIGAGAANTRFIIEIKKADTEVYAAKLADTYAADGFDDWYLPSIDELEELYKQRALVGGFDEVGTYWSSTGYDGGYTNGGYTDEYIFDPAVFEKRNKNGVQNRTNHVRPVRTLLGEK